MCQLAQIASTLALAGQLALSNDEFDKNNTQPDEDAPRCKSDEENHLLGDVPWFARRGRSVGRSLIHAIHSDSATNLSIRQIPRNQTVSAIAFTTAFVFPSEFEIENTPNTPPISLLRLMDTREPDRKDARNPHCKMS